jgi:DnaD/phage-associated family protein
MGIAIMSRVWESSKQSGSALLVILALADRADEDGICWPGIGDIARRARLGDRQVQRIIFQLKECGELYIQNAVGRGHTNNYFITCGLESEAISDVLKRRFDMSETAARLAAETTAKGDTQDTIKPKKGDTQDTVKEPKKVTPKTPLKREKVTPKTIKGDIAMSPEPSITVLNKPNNIISEVFTTYENEIGLLSPLIRDKVLDAAESYPPEWIIRAIGRAAEMQKRSWGYVAGILRNWEAIGGPQNDGPPPRAAGQRSNGRPANGSPLAPVYDLPDPPLAEPPAFWDLAREALRNQMSAATYDQLIAGTTGQPDPARPHTYLISAPTAQALDWLEHRLAETVTRVVCSVTGDAKAVVEFGVGL